MKKGSITIFLALTLTILSSLMMTLIEGARVSAMKLRMECVADMGIYSGFAEFHRELLEQYDLFFIDTSYGGQTFGPNRTTEHIKNYMEANFKPEHDLEAVVFRDWFSLSTEAVIPLEYMTASQEAGLALKRQAVDWIKEKTGLWIVEETKENFLLTKEKGYDVRDVSKEEQSIQQSIQNTELPMEQTESGEWKKRSLQNPADAVNSSRGSGILDWVVDNKSKISTRSADLSKCYSKRMPEEQNANAAGRESGGIGDEILFGEYLLEKCGSYQQQQEKNDLKYQVEYLLGGEGNDRENLKKTVNKLLLLREASNITYLLSDAGKMAEADAMAAGLSIIALVPELQPLIKYSLLFAWSFAESVNDVKILLNKGKVPLVKQGQDWKLSLENMLLFKNHLTAGEQEGSGLTYEHYLRILLLLMNPQQKVNRFMDIVELDIRQTPGNDCFRIEGCIDYLKIEMIVSSHSRKTYHIVREYRYT